MAQFASEIADMVFSQLRVSLSVQQRSVAIDEFRKYLAKEPQPTDANGNSRSSDDIVIWYLDWLIRSGLYSPSQHVSFIPTNPSGAGVLIFYGGDGFRLDPRLLQVGSPTSLFDSLPLDDGSTKAIVIPDEVRVPDIVGKFVAESEGLVNELSLALTSRQPLFDDDRVLSTEPRAGTWIMPSSKVSVTVERKLPSVEGLPVANAKQILSDKGFRQVNWVVPPGSADTVWAQEPKSGTYATLDKGLTLDPAVMVPDIGGMTMSDAERSLDTLGLPSSINKNGSLPTEDIQLKGKDVVRKESQTPKPGKHRRVDVKEVIAFAWEYVYVLRVPDVSNKLVTDATPILQKNFSIDKIVVEYKDGAALVESKEYTLPEWNEATKRLLREERERESRRLSTVTRTVPAANEQLAPGSPVTIIAELGQSRK
jgi:beta-lactam-binding protein with PASTA domain